MTGSIIVLALAVATLQAPADAAQQPAAATEALVQEVRALREAVEQVLSASIRVQLLMGRLQLQEARIQALARQNAEIDSQLAGLTSERQSIAFQRKMLQSGLAGMTNSQEQDELKQHLAMLVDRLEHLDTRQATLQVEQANVQQLLAGEQSRWGDFNARLEELERLLAGAGGR